MFSVMPFIREFIKIIEKIYLNNRLLQDLNDEPSNGEQKKNTMNDNIQNKRAM